MALKIAKRGMIPPFLVMEVMRAAFERERAGGQVLHLEIGQPSTPAPAGARAAAKAALDTDRLGYTDAFGIPPLRAAIVRYYRDRHRLTVAPERIVATTGSSAGFLLSFLAAFEPGDRVAMAAPSYPAYRHILAALGVEPVELAAGPENRFQPTVSLLEAYKAENPDRPLAGLIVASPSNPAGTMLSREDLAALAAYCRDQDLRLVSDEIYHGIGYGMPATTALAVSDRAVVVNSFSKYFSMTGWRLGWLVVPEDMARPIECLAQNLYISPPTLSQIAGVAAFDCTAELETHVSRYAGNRDLLLEELPKAGFDKLAPADGAFYLYADVSALCSDSEVFCRAMLADTGVAATPGIDFDSLRGRNFVRFSFCGGTDDIAEAVHRLKAWRRAA